MRNDLNLTHQMIDLRLCKPIVCEAIGYPNPTQRSWEGNHDSHQIP
jgi:hypothetical protein